MQPISRNQLIMEQITENLIKALKKNFIQVKNKNPNHQPCKKQIIV